MIPRYKMLVIFGGFLKGERSADTLLYDIDRQTWSILKPGNNMNSQPCARSGHSVIEYKDQMYIFGGRNQDGTALNDIWIFNMEKPYWREVVPKESA